MATSAGAASAALTAAQPTPRTLARLAGEMAHGRLRSRPDPARSSPPSASILALREEVAATASAVSMSARVRSRLAAVVDMVPTLRAVSDKASGQLCGSRCQMGHQGGPVGRPDCPSTER